MEFETVLPIIWGPDYGHSVCEPLTDALIAEAEQKLNITLPEEYLTLMRIRNGGFLRFDHHPKLDMELGQLFGIGYQDNQSIFNSEWDYYVVDDDGNEVPFPKESHRLIQICGDGHIWICLDYRSVSGQAGQPKVAAIGSELSEDEVIEESFRDYIEALQYSTPYYEFALSGFERDDDAIIAVVEKAIGVKLTDYRDEGLTGSLQTRIETNGKEGLLFLDNNQYDDGFVQLYDYPNHNWVLRCHNNVVTEQVEEKFRQQGLTSKLVHKPTI